MKLNGKVAIVTGAASGFGAEMARVFAANGAAVVVADINGEGAVDVANEINGQGGRGSAITIDVSLAADMQRAVDFAIATYGRMDIFVNNAAISHQNGPMLDVSEEQFDRLMNVNVKSIFLSCKAAVPVFRKQGGGVMLNIASTAGVRPRPGLAWYNSSKGAVITMTKTMAVELAADSIRVNALNPVAGDTPLLATFLPGEDTPQSRQKFIDTIPLGRLSLPADVAKAALFLVSDDAEFLTGVCMEVDGGRCI